MLAAGVIEVLAGSEQFHGLRAAASGSFEDSRMQPLFQEEMSRQNRQHVWTVLLESSPNCLISNKWAGEP
jgi:hypothetical protein